MFLVIMIYIGAKYLLISLITKFCRKTKMTIFRRSTRLESEILFKKSEANKNMSGMLTNFIHNSHVASVYLPKTKIRRKIRPRKN